MAWRGMPWRTNKNKISEFQIKDANPLRVQVANFLPEPEENESQEILLQAIDWKKTKKEQWMPDQKYSFGGTWKELDLN